MGSIQGLLGIPIPPFPSTRQLCAYGREVRISGFGCRLGFWAVGVHWVLGCNAASGGWGLRVVGFGHIRHKSNHRSRKHTCGPLAGTYGLRYETHSPTAKTPNSITSRSKNWQECSKWKRAQHQPLSEAQATVRVETEGCVWAWHRATLLEEPYALNP